MKMKSFPPRRELFLDSQITRKKFISSEPKLTSLPARVTQSPGRCSFGRKLRSQKLSIFFLSFQSLTILASIPAAILILSLFLLLLYLMTRCCDRKSKKQRTFGCQKCTLIFITILCCGAIGGGMLHTEKNNWVLAESQRSKFLISCFLLFLAPPPALLIGLYGNDDLHNGLVQVFNAGKQLNRLFINVRNQVIQIFTVPGRTIVLIWRPPLHPALSDLLLVEDTARQDAVVGNR